MRITFKKGTKNARRYRKLEFTEKEMPSVLGIIYMLRLEVDDLKTGFEKYKKQYAI